MRKLARTDANQSDVVKDLRQIGATVQTLHNLGRGCPDLLIGFRGVNYLVELKDGDKFASQQQLTMDERLWHDQWRGQVAVCNSLDEILNLIDAL